MLTLQIINNGVKNLTDEKRTNVFIIDDPLFNHTSCKKTKLWSRVFDHIEMKFRKGFCFLTLGWNNGNTFLLVNNYLLASSKESNIIRPAKEFDKRSIAGKRRGRSKYLLSVNVIMGKDNPVPVTIVCVRNKANRKDWLAFLCTNLDLSAEEFIRIYDKRWQVEVFFKICKSTLNLIGESRSLFTIRRLSMLLSCLPDICFWH